MEIQINNTPDAKDDLVQMKSDHPAHRPVVDCRIRATAACSTTSSVVLTNPDGRLRFTGPGDTTQSVSVPGDGSWVSFHVSGETGSNAIGDAVIQAHCNTATGPIKATKGMTVFWFDEAKIDLTAGGNYGMAGTPLRYTCTTGSAISMSASAKIKPAGVDCTAAQVAKLKIGIQQNVRPGVRLTEIYGPPTIAWNPGVAAGTSVTVPAAMQLQTNRPVMANDSEASVDPLYDQPGKTGTIDGNSMKPPLGCAGGAAATSNDTPQNPGTRAPITVPAVTAAGVNVGTVSYPLQSTRIDNSFLTWCVVVDTTTNEMAALKENTWELHAVSTSAGQKPTAGTARNPTVDPVTTGSYSNDIVNDPANQTTGAAPGGATQNFTK